MRVPILVVLASVSLASGEDGARLRFNRDVRPVLSNYCFECHGPDEAERRADVRLDTESGLAEVLELDADSRSELVHRLTTGDTSERMPPEDFRHELGEADRELLLRWIEEGAEFEEHWAYEPPRRGTVPEGSGDPIDLYLEAALAEAGLDPAPVADARTRVRRVFFDLTGLPPTPGDVESFREEDWSALVDRLLTSDAHAERMTAHWLDLVRYADTVGYHGDQEWTVWPYRDWVLAAFRDNMPFDQFTIEQLAGDLLPNPTLDQRVAATYCRLNMVTFEGGSQPKEFLAKYAADRVRTTSTVWLGSTLGCAECHDHKFDPFSARDFYTFAAYFADIEEQGVYNRFQDAFVPPQLEVPTAEQILALDRLSEMRDTVRSRIAAAAPSLREERREFERSVRRELYRGERFEHAWVDDVQSNGGRTEGGWHFVAEPRYSGEKSRRQESTGLVQHYFHESPDPLLVSEGDRFYAWVHLDPENPPEELMLQFHANGSWEHRKFWGADKIPFGGVGNDSPGHRRGGDLPKTGVWVKLEASPDEVGIAPGTRVDGMAYTQHGGRVHWDQAGLECASPALATSGLPAELVPQIGSAWGRTNDAAFDDWFVSIAPSLSKERTLLATARTGLAQERAAIPKIPATVSGTPRTTRILPRGNWMDDSGEVVSPATPHFLPAGEGSTRLDLAEWMVDPKNPLTARVMVNRLWRLCFGEGLAADVDDLGSQGAWPTHPELLDELALDFIESGWDVRAMLRRFVHTRAYQRRAGSGELFGSQRRWRLDAEFIRDGALFSSGLLAPRFGGPSVRPHQPAGYWAHLNFPVRTWRADTGDDAHRRGLYTFWCRTFLHPSLMAFDAPPREESCARRPVSDTPLQALVLLNDPAFVEAAQALAARVAQEHDGREARIRRAFALVLQREPTAEEAAILERLHGESEDGLVAVCRALLNLGEAVTRS